MKRIFTFYSRCFGITFLLLTFYIHSDAQIINTICGNATSGFSGDSGLAVSAIVNQVASISADRFGNVYFYDYGNARIRKINMNTGIIMTVAGTGVYGHSGDGGPGILAKIGYTPTSSGSIATDAAGNVYFAEETAPTNSGHCIRKINTSGIITTIAGVPGPAGYSPPGGLADTSKLIDPQGVAVDASGNIYIADGSFIKKVNGFGILSIFAGDGILGWSGDGGPADSAHISARQMTFDNAGNMYFDDFSAGEIRKINTSGVISRYAGTGGFAGYGGDNGPADSAIFRYPRGLACDSLDNLYIVDAGNYVIRKVDHISGIITTWGGIGHVGFSGDGCLVSCAEFWQALSGIVLKNSNLFICDGYRIREVTPGNCVCATSVNNVSENSAMSIYPNPVTGELTIDNGDEKVNEIIVRNILGETVLQKQNINSNKTTLDVSALPEGIYFAEVKENGRSVVKKFVKQ